ncbi:hypothetical protein BDZ85DRAFT_282613 [Elsinoe ampelina]|uniref:Uncharacterized protein n=1 Tax=Elsinoe ampelina TaxID=302913 RepID=A0A6A6GA58_9PEZI|nr:hypothetical protein BDZ85DRAFT_282613 [Elsinoe ampelina]
MATSPDAPRIDLPLRSSSFGSWYRIPDTIPSAAPSTPPATSPPSNPPPSPALTFRTSSWRTASGSSAVSSVSLDLATLRPYRATNYPPFAGDEELGGEGHRGGEEPPPYFEGFDGGPYVSEEEVSAPAPVREQREGRKPEEGLGEVLARPWTSMSTVALGETGRWERRMRVRAEVEEEFRRKQWGLRGKEEGREERQEVARERGSGGGRAWWDGRGSGLGELVEEGER